MEDEVDRRLNAVWMKLSMNILKIHTTTLRTTKQRNRENVHMSNAIAKRAIPDYGTTTLVKIRHFPQIFSDGVSA